MLNKNLCAIFGIDDFNQWLMKELDCVEEELHSSEISTPRYLELKGRYQALKDARDSYWVMNQSKLKEEKETSEQEMQEVAATEDTKDIEPEYAFEIILFDQEPDPERFKVLTHHFDYLYPLEQYPDVVVYGVNVDIDECYSEKYSKAGYRIRITGSAIGIRAQDLLSQVNLEDWGDVRTVSINCK